jgi:starch synthase
MLHGLPPRLGARASRLDNSAPSVRPAAIVSRVLRVLFVASECAGLVKTGGLGDVIAALPKALVDAGVDVRVLLPGYEAVLAALPAARECAALAPAAELPAARLLEARLPSQVPGYVLDCAELYERDGGPYQDRDGRDWPDNALRFGLLGHAAARIAAPDGPLAWKPDVLHAHDWQAALAPAYAALAGGPRAATVMTIHNLAFQGVFDLAWLAPLGVPPSAWSMYGVEYYGRLSFLKAGLYYADAITTVSPTYAREICAAPLGMGLEGLLAARSADLVGILNGIDDELWNPRTDRAIAARYGPASLWRKRRNKQALQAHFALAPRADVPLFGIVSRLTQQKGVDLVAAAAERIVALPAQLVVLGAGERALEKAIAAAAARHPGSVGVEIGFDERLAHAIEAGADAFLMPSRFEPCGMNQMYSQRYGTPPVVHATGGLADSVVDSTPATLADGTASGFAFTGATVDALCAAAGRWVGAGRGAPGR